MSDRNWRAELCTKRQAEGVSLRSLGASLGISFSTLARIERGQGQPDYHTQLILRRYLDGTEEVCQGTRCQERKTTLAVQCPCCQTVIELTATLREARDE